MMKNQLTKLQVITIFLILLFVFWESMMQLYLVDESLGYAVKTRYNWMIAFPILFILIIFSIRQYVRNSRN